MHKQLAAAALLFTTVWAQPVERCPVTGSSTSSATGARSSP